jgi:hypothetical protein
MEVFEIYLLVVLVISIAGIFLGLLFGLTSHSSSIDSLSQAKPLEIIKFPDTTIYTARIFADYPNKTILDKAKQLVDKNYPFHGAPHGGTYYVAKKREFYLNQYLWFYEKYKRLPYDQESIVEDYISNANKFSEIKPATWFSLIDKNELRAKRLFSERQKLWIAIKKSSGEEYKKFQKDCERVDKALTKLFNDDTLEVDDEKKY